MAPCCIYAQPHAKEICQWARDNTNSPMQRKYAAGGARGAASSGGRAMEEMNHGYFEEALSNFTKDFAYGGAIRHLVDHGYTVDRIIKEFHYPISRESIEKIVNQYLEQKK